MTRIKKTGGKLGMLLLTIFALTTLLALTGCEKNTPIIQTTEGGYAEVSVTFESGDSGERAAASAFTVVFTITVTDTGEEIQRQLEVVDHHAQGLLEIPAGVDLHLAANAEVNGIHYHGGIPIFAINEGEVIQGIEIFMFPGDDH
jgi:hypothetical protein